MSKEAMKLALEALRMAWDDEECSTSTHIAVKGGIKALEEALAKQEQGEPVAWQERQARRMQDGVVTEWTNWYPCRYRTIDEAQAEACDHIPYEWRPLYTTPQQRKPLTGEQIGKIWQDIDGGDGMLIRFARAIEAAHGIKE